MRDQNSRIGTDGQFRFSVPILDGIETRLAAVFGALGSKRAAAQALDVSDDTVGRWASGAGEPRLSQAAALCYEAAGPDWLRLLGWLVDGKDTATAQALMAGKVRDSAAPSYAAQDVPTDALRIVMTELLAVVAPDVDATRAAHLAVSLCALAGSGGAEERRAVRAVLAHGLGLDRSNPSVAVGEQEGLER